MAEQQLDSPDIRAGFQQMNCERMSKRMRRNRLAYTRELVVFWQACSTASLLMCRPGMSPGNSQWRGLFTRHQVRKISSRVGESIT